MRAAIFDPYLDTGGGGERYVMTVAQVLAKNGWEVDLAWKSAKIIPWLEVRLGLKLGGIEIVDDISRGAGYDLVFWLSDGSIPTLFGAKNILHFQTPFHDVDGRSLPNRLKLTKIHHVICNSRFTKSFIDKEYGVESLVIYPPVDTENLRPGKKEKLIIAVGRFSQLQQAKRQDILVDVFAKIYNEGLRGWRFILAGGSEVGGREIVRLIKSKARGYPIDVLENLPFSELKKFYARAKIFWSTAGFGVNSQTQPEKVEHFGLATAEAMAAGCLPIIFAAGGHNEVVANRKDGFLWHSLEELKNITIKLIRDEKTREKFAKAAQKKAAKFSKNRFEEEIIRLLE